MIEGWLFRSLESPRDRADSLSGLSAQGFLGKVPGPVDSLRQRRVNPVKQGLPRIQVMKRHQISAIHAGHAKDASRPCGEISN